MKPLNNLLRNFSSAFDFEKTYLGLCKQLPSESSPFLIALEKNPQNIYRYETKIVNNASYEAQTLLYIERILKCLLWMRGGHTFFIHTNDKKKFDFLKKVYSSHGARAWDVAFIVEQIYNKTLDFVYCEHIKDVPKSKKSTLRIGGNSNGQRIGLDLGGSDKKVAVVDNGKVLFTKSIVWNPLKQTDLNWHIKEIDEALRLASSHLSKVEAIGVSVPGICEDNEIKVSSIFQGLSKSDQIKSRTLFKKDVQNKWQVPIGLANDGDVSALFGALKYKKRNLLAIAMGTSVACGYINDEGFIENSFNEFAFVPIDYDKEAPNDPWSNDIGCGSQYFSQQAVYRLAKKLALPISSEKSLAENLITVQNLAEENHLEALQIFHTVGFYLAYAIAHYSRFYKIDSVLLLGRVLKGAGGKTIIKAAKENLSASLSHLNIGFYSLTEEEILHSQAIAASSIPILSE